MKILILGDGLLSKELVKQTGWDYLSRKKDGINISEFNNWFFKMYKYDVIINCIAHTDTYSQDRENHWKVNYEFVDTLVNFCNETGKKLVHISTDYIYTNSIPESTEDDVPVHLGTWYGYTKLLGDAHVQLKSKNYLICRLSHKPYPFPYEQAWTDIKTNGDFVNVISELIIKLIEKNANGVFNVGTEVKSIYDLVIKTKNVTPINKPSYVPDDTSMSLRKLNSTI